MECITRIGILEEKYYADIYFESEEEKKDYIKILNALPQKEIPLLVNEIPIAIKEIIVGDKFHLSRFNPELKTYNPLYDASELYTELNKIKMYDMKSLRKFIKSYGLPLGEIVRDREISKNEWQMSDDRLRFNYAMDVHLFFNELEFYKETMLMWEYIDKGRIDSRKLNHLIHSFDLDAVLSQFFSLLFQYPEEVKAAGLSEESTYQEIFPFVNKFMLEHKSAERTYEYDLWFNAMFKAAKNGIGQIKTPTKEIIMYALTTRLDKKSKEKKVPYVTKIRGSDELKIVEGIRFNNLFDVAYYQLKQAIYKQMHLKICEECGYPFVPTHAKQRFCPAKRNVKRSACENTFNSRLKRKAKKEKEMLNKQ